MSRIILFAFAIVPSFPQGLPAPAAPPPPHCDSYSMQNLPKLDFRQKACFWSDQLVTGSAISGAALWGAVAEWRHAPREWPQGFQGFGEQFGTRYAQGMVKSTATFISGAVMGEDPRTKPPLDVSCSGHSRKIMPRLGHSLLRVVWIPSPDCSTGRPAISRFVGSFASGFVSLEWQPPSTNHLSYALQGSGTAFAGYLGNSVFTEFQGDLYRILGKVFSSGKPKQKVP
jgi:hypothetical protein